MVWLAYGSAPAMAYLIQVDFDARIPCNRNPVITGSSVLLPVKVKNVPDPPPESSGHSAVRVHEADRAAGIAVSQIMGRNILVTTLPAPITAPSPILTPPSTTTLQASQTLSPIWDFCNSATLCRSYPVQLSLSNQGMI